MSKGIKVLFIVGIVLLAVGIWLQDIHVSVAYMGVVNVMTRSMVIPRSSSIMCGLSGVQPYIRGGMALKLTGLAMLLGILVSRLQARAGKDSKKLTRLALAASVCFALATVFSPPAGLTAWTMRVFAARFALLDSPGYEAIQSSVFAAGFFAVIWALVLAAGFLLLALIVRHYVRGRSVVPTAGIVAPAALVLAGGLDAFGRPETDYGQIVSQAGSFQYIGSLLIVLAVVLFIWALAVRNRDRRRNALLAFGLAVVAGVSAVLFWVFVLVHMSGPGMAAEGVPSEESIGQFGYPPIAAAMQMSGIMLLSAVFLPILFAFLLKRPGDEDLPRKLKTAAGSRIPVIAVIAVFAVSGAAGLYENPRRSALRSACVEVSGRDSGDVGGDGLIYEKGEEWRFYAGGMPHDCTWEEEWEKPLQDSSVTRLESKEGLDFLREMLTDAGKTHWHEFVVDFLWNWARSRRAKALVAEMMFREDCPCAAAAAYRAVCGQLKSRSSRWKIHARRAMLVAVKEEPHVGGKLLLAVLQSPTEHGDFILQLMDACASAGVKEFKLVRNVIRLEDREDPRRKPPQEVNLPRGFTVYFGMELGADAKVLNIGLGRSGSYYKNPDFSGITENLAFEKKHCKPGTRIWVVVQVHRSVPAYHLSLLLGACARAGINEACITEMP